MSAQVKLPTGQVMTWKQHEFPTVYANLMGFGISPFDITLIFGELGESTSTEVLGVPKVKILLSPEQASNLQKMLGIAVKTYVDNNGPLRTAGAVNVEELTKQVDAQKVKVQQ
ncbi:MAG: DUF3467 domain-containing protein [Acidobacteriaceae bacterium]